MTQRICIQMAAFVFISCATTALIGCASAETESSDAAAPVTVKLEYTSSQLMMKNSDQMNEIIKRKMQKAGDAQAAQEVDEDAEGLQVEPEAIVALKDGVRIALSRPDQDGARAAMFSRLRRELQDLNSLDGVLQDITTEAIAVLKGRAQPKVQATYVYILENLMAELKPDLANNGFYRKLVEQVRDADIRLAEELLSQQLLRTMAKPVSPSETAAKILPKQKKKR